MYRNIYEQTNTEGIIPENERVQMPSGGTAESGIGTNDTSKTIDTGGNKKNALYAFPIDKDTLAELNEIIKKGSGELKSDAPISYVKDENESDLAYINSKPVYLMIRVSDSKLAPLADSELNDRVYVTFDTNAQELERTLDAANNFKDKIIVSVKTPINGGKKEHSIALWKIDSDGGFVPKDAPTSPNNIVDQITKAVTQSLDDGGITT